MPFGERDERFEAADGWHRVKVKRLFETMDPNKVRIIVSLLDSESLVYDYVAGKTFPKSLRPHTELRKSLLDGFGEDLSLFLDQNGEIDLQKIVGQRLCIRVENRPSPNYELPYCNILEFAPIHSFGDN